MGWVMRKAAMAVLLGAVGLGSNARAAADRPTYGPPPAWVKEVPIPTDVKPSGAAVDVLLMNNQQRLSPGDDQMFTEIATRVNASEGLMAVGNVTEAWDPSTEDLIIHRARLIRNGKVIDLLAGGKTFTVIRRETSLEAATLDGTLTATLQPEDVRVGDVLDVAVTQRRREPALAGHSEATLAAIHPGVLHRLVFSTSWPKSRSPRIWKTDDLPALVRHEDGDRLTIGLEQIDNVNPEPPKGAEFHDSVFGLVTMSDFADWSDVSRSLFPLYDKAAELPSTSPLKAEIARIAAAHPDPKGRALAAMKLVEGDVRYLALLMDAGGYTPAAADLTWSRRFGDCKGKTVLLLALFRGLGIEATPAVVNTMFGDGLGSMTPSIGLFNHVFLRARIGGRLYWLDGTRLGDENLDVIPIPNYHYALPLTREGEGLAPLAPKDPDLPLEETRMRVDLSSGLDRAAKVHREVVIRGDSALFMKLALAAASPTDRDRRLRDILRGGRDWIDATKLSFTYDPMTMTFVGTLDGQGKPPFTSPEGARDQEFWIPSDDLVAISSQLARTTDYHRDVPYGVDYPAFSREEVEVTLPDGGKGFTVANAGPIHREVGGVAYSRAASLGGDHFSEIISRRAVASSFPAADAPAVEIALKNMDSYDVSLGYTTSKSVAPPAKDLLSGDPMERGEAAFRDKAYADAETAFSEGLKVSPSARLFADRAAARAAQGRIDLAEADLKSALSLDPKDATALFSLGRIALKRGQEGEAEHRFEAAHDAAPDKGAMAVRIADTLWDAEARARAVPWWDRAVAEGPRSGTRRERIVISACLSRVRVNRADAASLAVCNEAVALEPLNIETKLARGWVRQHQGDWSGALTDFDAVLAAQPNFAPALYGRALVERHAGDSAKAEADLKAAKAISATVDQSWDDSD